MKPKSPVNLDPTLRAYNPRYLNETSRTKYPMYAGGSGYVLSYAVVARLNTIRITDTSPLPFRHFPREDATVRGSDLRPRPLPEHCLLPTRRLCPHRLRARQIGTWMHGFGGASQIRYVPSKRNWMLAHPRADEKRKSADEKRKSPNGATKRVVHAEANLRNDNR